MAKCFLGIPATSAPSKRVFSKSKTVIGLQQHSLSLSSLKHLVCVKDWYQKFDEMMDISSIDTPNNGGKDDAESAEEDG
jgi:hypothetical protein